LAFMSRVLFLWWLLALWPAQGARFVSPLSLAFGHQTFRQTNTLKGLNQSGWSPAWDGAGRRTELTQGVNAGEANTLVAYTYTNGLLDHVAMSGQIVRTNYYAYDSLRRLRKKDTPEGVLTYTYTNNGSVLNIQAFRRTSVGTNAEVGAAVPDVNLAYLYDRLGRVASAADRQPSTTNTTTYAYDPVGNLGKFAYPNQVTNSYSYTEQNRLKSVVWTKAGGTVLRQYNYSLNAQGRRTNLNESAGGTRFRQAAYEHDQDYTGATTPAQVGRLTRELLFNGVSVAKGSITNVSDAVGNRLARQALLTNAPVDLALQTNQSLAFDVNDRISGSPWSYDLNGNTVSDNSGASTTYYDAENHLLKQVSSTLVISNSFDFEGNRVGKRVGTTNTFYLIDNLNPSGWPQVLAEYSSVTTSVAPSVSYVYGLALISERQSNGTNSYYGFDGQGSVRFLVEWTGNVLTDTFDYDAYGLRLATNSATPNNYLYTGQQWDPDWGMYYLRARFYQPNEGRFWTGDTHQGSQEDPLSLHRYVYCSGDPINEFDPLGESFFAFDGTGNYPGETDEGVPAPSNIYKLWYGSTDSDRHYEVGVGTGLPVLSFPGLAFGAGMARRESKAMRELRADRASGDKSVDIVGFSRGGIEATEFANRVADAFGADETIRFVGLFDPVGSVGHPGGFGSYRTQLPAGVGSSVEAMAANENRSTFPGTDVKVTTQKWFRGTHSDIGGGWANQQLSDYVLQWMIQQAQGNGVGINLSAIQSRFGWKPDPNGPIDPNHGITSWLTTGSLRNVRSATGGGYTIDPSGICF